MTNFGHIRTIPVAAQAMVPLYRQVRGVLPEITSDEVVCKRVSDVISSTHFDVRGNALKMRFWNLLNEQSDEHDMDEGWRGRLEVDLRRLNDLLLTYSRDENFALDDMIGISESLQALMDGAQHMKGLSPEGLVDSAQHFINGIKNFFALDASNILPGGALKDSVNSVLQTKVRYLASASSFVSYLRERTASVQVVGPPFILLTEEIGHQLKTIHALERIINEAVCASADDQPTFTISLNAERSALECVIENGEAFFSRLKDESSFAYALREIDRHWWVESTPGDGYRLIFPLQAPRLFDSWKDISHRYWPRLEKLGVLFREMKDRELTADEVEFLKNTLRDLDDLVRRIRQIQYTGSNEDTNERIFVMQLFAKFLNIIASYVSTYSLAKGMGVEYNSSEFRTKFSLYGSAYPAEILQRVTGFLEMGQYHCVPHLHVARKESQESRIIPQHAADIHAMFDRLLLGAVRCASAQDLAGDDVIELAVTQGPAGEVLIDNPDGIYASQVAFMLKYPHLFPSYMVLDAFSTSVEGKQIRMFFPAVRVGPS